jgi:hypothetical protein
MSLTDPAKIFFRNLDSKIHLPGFPGQAQELPGAVSLAASLSRKHGRKSLPSQMSFTPAKTLTSTKAKFP